MAVYLAVYGPKEESLSFWLGIIGWAIGFAGNSESPTCDTLVKRLPTWNSVLKDSHS